jgi:hypothetical protein
VLRTVVARTLTLLFLAAAWSPRPVRADAVVGTGTGSCTEAALEAALAGGGNVTFNCGASAVTITVTGRKIIAVDTSLDGGSLITLSGGGVTQLFLVNSGATLTLAKLTIGDGAVDDVAIFNDDGGTLNVSDRISQHRTRSGGGHPGGGALAESIAIADRP